MNLVAVNLDHVCTARVMHKVAKPAAWPFHRCGMTISSAAAYHLCYTRFLIIIELGVQTCWPWLALHSSVGYGLFSVSMDILDCASTVAEAGGYTPWTAW
jgi:hypothetical protein